MFCRKCVRFSTEVKLIYCGADGSFICTECYEDYFIEHEQQRLATAPVEKSIVSRGYKPGLNLEIIPYFKSERYEDVVSFEDPRANQFYLVDNDSISEPFENLESAFTEYLKRSDLRAN